ELALNQGFNVKIAGLNGSKDPDELIKKGIGLWEKSIKSAGSYIDYYFDQIFAAHDAISVEGKREITKELAPLIFRMADPVTKAHYVRKLSQGIDVAENSIWDIISKLNTPKSVRKQAQTLKHKPRRDVLADQVIGLSLLLSDDAYIGDLGLIKPTEKEKKELLVFS